MGINGTAITSSQIKENLKISQIQESQLFLIIGGQAIGEEILVPFALKELRLFKNYLHPSIIFSQYSQSSRFVSSYYWKLFPIYTDTLTYEFQTDQQFSVPRLSSVEYSSPTICEGNNYRDHRYPNFCRKISNRFMKFKGSFESQISIREFKSLEAPLDFTVLFWFQSDAVDPTQWITLNIAQFLTITVNSQGQVRMIHNSGTKIHEAQTLRLLSTLPSPNIWLNIAVTCKQGVLFNTLVESLDKTFSESESHEINSGFQEGINLNSFKLLSQFQNSVLFIHNLLIFNFAYTINSLRQLSQEQLQLFQLDSALAYIRFISLTDSNAIVNLVNPESNLIFSSQVVHQQVSSSNDSEGDLHFECHFFGLQSNGTECTTPYQVVQCQYSNGYCSRDGTLLFCESGSFMNLNPPLCVNYCATSQRKSIFGCIDPICTTTYQTSQKLCSQKNFNIPSLTISPENTLLALEFSELTSLSGAMQSSRFSITVEGTFSQYDLTWSLITQIVTGGKFEFNLLIKNTLSGGGREKLIFNFLDQTLFQSLNGRPLSTFVLQIPLNAQINPQFSDDIANAKVVDSVATALVYTVMSQQFALALAAGWSLSFLWGILNFLQVFQFLMLIDANFPKNFLEFQEIAQVANFQLKILQTLPNFISILVDENQLNDSPLNDIFNDQEFEYIAFTNVHRGGTNFAFIFLSMWPLMLIIKLILQKCCSKSKKCKCSCVISKINSVYSFNGFYRFFLQIYFELAICAFISSTNLSFRNRSQIIVSLHAIIALILVAFFPIYSYIYLCLKKQKFKKKKFLEKRGALIQDLKEVKPNKIKKQLFTVYYYYPLFLIKRIIFSIVLVFWRDSPIPQLWTLFSISAISLIFTSVFRPFQDKIRNAVQILEDSIFVLVFLIVTMLTMHPVSESVSFKCGWLLVAIPLTSLAFSIGIIIVTTIINFISLCKKCKKRKKLAPHSKILSNNLSPSNTIPQLPALDSENYDQSNESRKDLNIQIYRANDHNTSEIVFQETMRTKSNNQDQTERPNPMDASQQELTIEDV